MKIKKITSLLLVTLLLFSNIKLTLATETLDYEEAQSLAEQHIENFSKDELWNGQNPTIVSGNYFYTDKENRASYIEFKVSCDNTEDCGFIMVNIDGDDVTIPFSSTSGTTASEILLQKLKHNDTSLKIKKSDYKLYYFSPFDQYVQDKENKIAISLNPADDIDSKIQTFELNEKLKIKQDNLVKSNAKISLKNVSREELFANIDEIQINKSLVESKKIEFQDELYNKLENLKKEAVNFKKSEEFKQRKLEIKDKIGKVKKSNYIGKKLELNDNSGISTRAESIGNHVFVDGTTINQSTCVGKTPCYSQFRTTYYTNGVGWQSCRSGCGPTVVGIVFGYYSNNGRYDLMTSQYPGWTLSPSVRTDIEDIGDMIGTYCDEWGEGATPADQLQIAKQFAKDFGYSGTESVYQYNKSLYDIYWKVITEVSEDRPLILITENSNSAHVIVAFGYYVDTYNSSNYTVRVNMGWGHNPIASGSSIYGSNMDIDLDSVYISAGQTHIVKGWTTFEIDY